MDNDKEYVEVYNDDDESVVGQGGSKEDPRKLRRYKDDAYRCPVCNFRFDRVTTAYNVTYMHPL